ncbi:MAG: V-type ATP synthase subunit D [Spirochaetes bacterium]|nr:V-type ATP synthase subunit D [Spirochaetota bacterium]
MSIQVNPNRMELLQLKRKQQVAVRGHKLLKDKLEGLLKDFMQIIKDYKVLRNQVDAELSEMFQHLILASASMPKQAYLTALAFPQCEAKLRVEEKLLMNVRIPIFNFTIEGNMLSYSIDSTNYDLDEAMGRLKRMLERMVKLAELEKTIELVAAEIEKTRRRVNALEYILIPQQEEAIKYISSKLDELERSNTTRLMKIKEMLRM